MEKKYKELSINIEETIREIYVNENLTNIAGLDQSYLINGKQILQWQGSLVKKGKNRNPAFDPMKLFDECLVCFDEIMYFTAFLFLYKPFVVNPVNHPVQTHNTTIYVYNQNSETKRFCMYTNIAFEKLYNYWDRIGDFIIGHFPGVLREDKIYFSTVIDYLLKNRPMTSSLDWLNNFRQNEYKYFNEKRKKAVHYFGADTEYKWDHIKNMQNRAVLEKAYADLCQVPEYIKGQMQYIREGIFHTLSLIEQI